MSPRHGGELEALDFLQRELRGEQLPGADWDRVEKRVLVLIGAGHVPILRHAALSSPDYHLVEVREVLGSGSKP